ncbi:hypothetical protein LOTGIDRAFT_193167 [Lottia gigantea]|uniref:Heme-binding protein 2 n=1 Tax=Lottia gigantea TaxID=225164 RepID=V4A1V5_LOTGI|nr:hypothetical protein LOTGIDRAFT_193167 [Lottia gigantea]ESO88880.1 hypothetical protein LOTGIDRAFT_193167 [Lottia gigantea]
MFTAIKTAFTSKGLDMPEYTVLNKTEDSAPSPPYEERQYPETKWVSTSIQGMVLKEATSKGFRRLFNYIQGANKSGVKIEMTSPVPTKVVPGAGPNCENTFTVSFFIPPENAANPPEPTDKDVFIDSWPAQTIYARTFGGFAKDDDWLTNSQELAKDLKDKPLNQSYWFTAGYDSPFKMFSRRNEVWYVKAENSEQ